VCSAPKFGQVAADKVIAKWRERPDYGDTGLAAASLGAVEENTAGLPVEPLVLAPERPRVLRRKTRIPGYDDYARETSIAGPPSAFRQPDGLAIPEALMARPRGSIDDLFRGVG
jgi:hypothetical protein